jgi:hypothetical protein
MKTAPKLIDASHGIYAWSGEEDLVHVLYSRDDRQEIIESYVGVPDRDLDDLLDHVAGGVVLGENEPGYDLVLVRGGTVLGFVHRNTGRPSTFTRHAP